MTPVAYDDFILGLGNVEAHWPLYEATGTSGSGSVADLAGSNAGTPTSVTFAAGSPIANAPGNIASFNRSSPSSISTTALGNFGSTVGAFSVIAWVRSSYTAAYQAILGNRITAGGAQFSIYANFGGGFGTGAGRIEAAGLNEAGTARAFGTAANTGICDGQWHLFVGTFDLTADLAGTPDSWKLYVDAQQIAISGGGIAGSAIANFGANFGQPFGLGYRAGDNDGHWQGDLSRVSILRRILTPAEIRAIRSEGLASAGIKRPFAI